MTQEIPIEEMAARDALEVAVEVSMFRIPKVLGDWFPRILKHIEAGNGESDGAPYARYLDINWPEMRDCGMLKQIWFAMTRKQKMRIGIPVKAGATGDGEIQSVSYPAGRYVRTVHRGPYHKVGAHYKIVAAWAGQQGVTLADTTIENYINDPTEVKPEDIETLILIPLEE